MHSLTCEFFSTSPTTATALGFSLRPTNHLHPSQQKAQHSTVRKMASRPTEHAEEAHQASTELANPTGIRGNIEQASDTDTAMHPEHKTPAKEKAEKKGTSNSFLGRILGQAYTWLTSGRADQKNYNAKSSDATDKSPEDNDKARGCLFHVPADFRMDRHEHRSQNWLEDAEATSEYQLTFLLPFILQLAHTPNQSLPGLLGQAQRGPGCSSLQKQD